MTSTLVFAISAILIAIMVALRSYEIRRGSFTFVSRFFRSKDDAISKVILKVYNRLHLMYVHTKIFVSASLLSKLVQMSHDIVAWFEDVLGLLRGKLKRKRDSHKPVSLYLKAIEEHKKQMKEVKEDLHNMGM